MKPLDPSDRRRRVFAEPGKEHLGICVAVGDRLEKAALIRPPPGYRWPQSGLLAARDAAAFVRLTNWQVDQLIFEWPQAYQQSGASKNNDILPLCGTDFALATQLGVYDPMPVEPGRWKGNIDADIVTERVRKKLEDSGELALIEGKAEHNVLDSCGLFLWFVGRMHLEKF